MGLCKVSRFSRETNRIFTILPGMGGNGEEISGLEILLIIEIGGNALWSKAYRMYSVVCAVIKLSKKLKLRIIQAYALISERREEEMTLIQWSIQ